MDALFHNIEVLIQGQHVLAFLLVFVAGLISASSPCIIAAIPLIIGYVGGYSNGSRARAALFSAIFVLGLSLTFTLLGAAASTVGQLLGFLGVWLEYGFAALAIIMGLHLLGAITVPLPFQKTHQIGTKGLFGAFLLGVLTGSVSTPCATPVLAVILTYVSTKGDLYYGSALLFVYAIGHCALIFVAGLSVGIAESLISSKGLKNFALYSKRISGLVLLLSGTYLGFINL